jgi:predicted signal transduction protein with EAL and GGDEF domain
MLQRLGYVVTAEGVETAQDLAFVVDCGVQRVQGWYFSAAVPAEDLPERVTEIHLRLAASQPAANAPWHADLEPVEAQASRPGALH